MQECCGVQDELSTSMNDEKVTQIEVGKWNIVKLNGIDDASLICIGHNGLGRWGGRGRMEHCTEDALP